MLNRRLVPCVWVLTGCLVGGSGCARSGVVARGVAPQAAAESVVAVKAVEENADSAAPEETTPFRFPDDRGGALLSKVLPPDVAHAPVERRMEPRRPASPTLDSPSLPLPTNAIAIPRLPAVKPAAPLQPRLVLIETLGGTPLEPRLPQTMALPAGELTRLPSVDVNQPVPLPILGQPLSDRAPVEDVTVEASSASVVAVTPPQRTRPTPFVRNNLPDPFEFRHPVGTLKVPAEQPNPPVGSPKLPRP